MRRTVCPSERGRRTLMLRRSLLVGVLLSALLLSCNWRAEAYRIRDELHEQATRADRELRRLSEPIVQEMRRFGREIGDIFGTFGQ